MSEQASFTFDRRRYDVLKRQFEKFHDENPEVWELFQRYTFELIRRGFKHHSADAVCHRIRWHIQIETSDPDFKINNNYTAFYARKWIKEYPEYGDFFQLRDQISRRR